MSHRFQRCLHCGLPHGVQEKACPITGRPLEVRLQNKSWQVMNAVGQVPMIAAAPKPAPVVSQAPQSARNPAKAPVQQAKPSPVKPNTSSSQNSLSGSGGVFVPVPIHSDSTVNAANTRSNSLIGKTLGGTYLCKRVLGEGGMGTVYECEHLVQQRPFAVKVLHPAQARKQASVQRFHHEAQVASEIGHPNICRVFDKGILDDNSPFLVMELLRGETLADRVAAEGALALDVVVDVMIQVLAGLTAAHEKNIIHRDIKPENVFLHDVPGEQPIVKLLDFGISKMTIGENLNLTRTGMVMGTPYYMSPEQARGERNLDQRVDIYAAGVLMYEILTGKRPFNAPNYNALLVQILTTRPKSPRELRPALSEPFESIVLKAMHRDRERRYQSAREMQMAVHPLRAVTRVVPKREEPKEKPVPPVQPAKPAQPASLLPKTGNRPKPQVQRPKEDAIQPPRPREFTPVSVAIDGNALLDSSIDLPPVMFDADVFPKDSASVEIPIVADEPRFSYDADRPTDLRPPPAHAVSEPPQRMSGQSVAPDGDDPSTIPAPPMEMRDSQPHLHESLAPRLPRAPQVPREAKKFQSKGPTFGGAAAKYNEKPPSVRKQAVAKHEPPPSSRSAGPPPLPSAHTSVAKQSSVPRVLADLDGSDLDDPTIVGAPPVHIPSEKRVPVTPQARSVAPKETQKPKRLEADATERIDANELAERLALARKELAERQTKELQMREAETVGKLKTKAPLPSLFEDDEEEVPTTLFQRQKLAENQSTNARAESGKPPVVPPPIPKLPRKES